MKLQILFILATLSFSSMAFGKVGFVNARKALESVKEGKKILSKLESELKKRENKIEKEQAKIKKAQDDFRKKAAILSDSGRAKKQQEVQKMMAEYQEKTMAMQKELQQMEAKLKKPLIEKMGKIIETVSKQEGVDITFEALQAPLYMRSKVDLTDKVIEAYNKKHK